MDRFVTLLQRQSEHKQGWQQVIQGAALFSTMIILLIGLYELQYGVVTPLQELVDATQRFRRGEFQVRVNHQSEDELGQLATSFNTMAETIEQSHRTLEKPGPAKDPEPATGQRRPGAAVPEQSQPGDATGQCRRAG
nr:hypothetical protein GCM10020185_71550 [Pseudomonas brassicacearum subsp. brassicacearum]